MFSVPFITIYEQVPNKRVDNSKKRKLLKLDIISKIFQILFTYCIHLILYVKFV